MYNRVPKCTTLYSPLQYCTVNLRVAISRIMTRLKRLFNPTLTIRRTKARISQAAWGREEGLEGSGNTSEGIKRGEIIDEDLEKS